MKYADILRAQVDELEAERTALLEELDTLAPVEGDETRSAEAVEVRAAEIVARGQAIKADVDAKVARIGELDALATERAAVPSAPAFIKSEKLEATDIRSLPAAKLVDQITRSVEDHDIDPDHARKLVKRHGADRDWLTGIAVRSTDVYSSAFGKLMTGREYDLTSEERAAVAVGTTTQGGFLVPTHLDPTLILTNSGSSNAIRALARVVTLGREKTWNGVSTAGSDFSWDAELAEVSDDSPTFAQPSIATHVGAGFIQASYQAFEDIENLASDVAMLLADGRDRLEAAAHATGNGSTQPKGIFTALDANAGSEVVSATAATIALADLTGLKRAVPVRYRGSSTWLMNPVYADAIKALGTAVSASYSGDITVGAPSVLLGRPLVESDEAPSTQTTTVRDNEIVVGDFSQYVIVDKPGSTSLDFIPNLFNTTTNLPDGRRGWYMRFRSGADVTNALAFRLLQDKTSA
jgi:HK97 family phage major capsid protein